MAQSDVKKQKNIPSLKLTFLAPENQWDFQGPPMMGPPYGKLPILFPYHSHEIPKDMGMVWVPLTIFGGPMSLGVSLKFPLRKWMEWGNFRWANLAVSFREWWHIPTEFPGDPGGGWRVG